MVENNGLWSVFTQHCTDEHQGPRPWLIWLVFSYMSKQKAKLQFQSSWVKKTKPTTVTSVTSTVFGVSVDRVQMLFKCLCGSLRFTANQEQHQEVDENPNSVSPG